MRVNVYLPDELAERVRTELPELNVSGKLQEALREALDCHHARLECACCSAELSRAGLEARAVEYFYRELLHELGPLVDNAGTAEGAARIAKRLALDAGVAAADRLPLPRPPRLARTRAEHNATRLPMAHHPTTEYRRRTG